MHWSCDPKLDGGPLVLKVGQWYLEAAGPVGLLPEMLSRLYYEPCLFIGQVPLGGTKNSYGTFEGLLIVLIATRIIFFKYFGIEH